METKILVKSSSRIEPYEVLVASNEGRLSIYCNCPAGEWGKYCKHKMALVLGDEKILYDNDQIGNFNEVSELIQESNYPILIAELQDSEKKLEAAKNNMQASKDKIAHLMKDGLSQEKAASVERKESPLLENMPIVEIEAFREERSYALIANFIDGFARGWKMAIPESFKEALDIKLTPRTLAGKTEMFWTQGRNYNFLQGYTIYDTKLAYEKWEEALKHIKIGVSVLTASPMRYINYETIETVDKGLKIKQTKGTNKQKDEVINRLVIKKQRLNHGSVKFRVHRPNNEKTKLEECELFECTQDDFVAFLQTGIIRTPDNKQLNLL